MRNFLGVIIVFVLSCCNNSKYENYHSFENSIWHTDSIVKFKYIVTDTTKKYNINLKIRHTVDYQFQNLFVFVETDKIDTVEVFLAKKEWRVVRQRNKQYTRAYVHTRKRKRVL